MAEKMFPKSFVERLVTFCARAQEGTVWDAEMVLQFSENALRMSPKMAEQFLTEWEATLEWMLSRDEEEDMD